MPRPRFVNLVLFVLCLHVVVPVCSVAAQELTRRPLHAEPSPQVPSEVINHQLLTPPFRGSAMLRFSPNGRFLVLQDHAGLFVLSREPLGILLYIDAPDAYPARFSNDSRTVSLLSYELVLATWQLSDGKNLARREWAAPEGCLQAELVPGAAWLACLTPQFTLDFYKTDDLTRAFSQHVGSFPSEPGLVPIPLGIESAFSRPFGFSLAGSFARAANRRLFRLPAVFPPDGSYFVLRPDNDRYDLPTFRKSGLSGQLRKLALTWLAILPQNRVLVANNKQPFSASIVSLASGEMLAPVQFTSAFLALATNPRYALLANAESAGVALFDLEQGRLLNLPPNLDADIFGDTVALFTAEGGLQFYHLGEPHPFLSRRLPLNDLPRLRAALVDSSLSTLAISANQDAAIFDLTNGKRLAAVRDVDGFAYDTPQSAFLIHPRRLTDPASVMAWNSASTAPGIISKWTASNKVFELRPGEKAFLEYSFLGPGARPPEFVDLTLGAGFELRGLDPASGRELWKRTFAHGSPVPFDDPQGSRLVLGWEANTESARRIAKSFPDSQAAYKNQKPKDVDSFFEVLDAVTGNSLAGVLVQFGTGPSSFDSAFSCGTALFLIKDQYRIALFDLQTGSLVARLHGKHPSASAAAKLFVTDEKAKVTFYDLTTGTRLGDRKFPDDIAYTRFSETGDRLFVLTAHQEAFVLDVKRLREGFAKFPNELPVETH